MCKESKFLYFTRATQSYTNLYPCPRIVLTTKATNTRRDSEIIRESTLANPISLHCFGNDVDTHGALFGVLHMPESVKWRSSDVLALCNRYVQDQNSIAVERMYSLRVR